MWVAYLCYLRIDCTQTSFFLIITFSVQLLQAGSDQFNTKPKKGIEFLQEHSLLSTPLNPEEIAKFLKENPKLDKKMVADYIGDRRNAKVLDAFVR